MIGIVNKMAYSMALISPENLAGYVVTAFFTIINLLVTYFIIKRFLFKPAIKFMKKRKDAVEQDITEGTKMREDATKLLDEGKSKIDTATHEATVILDDAKIRAETQGAQIIENARREASEIISRGHNDIGLLKKAAIEEMRNEVADLALAIAYKVVSQTLDDGKQKELVNRFIEEEFNRKDNANA